MPKVILDYIPEKLSWVAVLQCDSADDKLDSTVTRGIGAMLLDLQSLGFHGELLELGEEAEKLAKAAQDKANAEKFPLIYLPDSK